MLYQNDPYRRFQTARTCSCPPFTTQNNPLWHSGAGPLAAAILALCALFLAFAFAPWNAQVIAWADELDDGDSQVDGDGETGDDGDQTGEVDVVVPPSSSSNGSSGSKQVDEYGGIIIQLVDSEMEQAEKNGVDLGAREDDLDNFTQGDACFEGMLFEIYDGDGDLVAKMKADELGVVSLPEKKHLPLGTYIVKQNEASAKELGYHADKKWTGKGKKVVIDIPDAEVDAGTCKCEPIRGAIRLNRVDGELYDSMGIEDAAQGKGQLVDAVYQVYNASASTVIVDDIAYKPYDESLEPELAEGDESEDDGKTDEADSEEAEEEIDYDDGIPRNRPIMEITTDEAGIAVTGEEAGPYDKFTGLPWGTYLIKEKKASKGYRKDKRWSVVAEVRGEERFDAQDVARATAIRGGAKLSMVDGETKDGSPQGDASLKGAVFEVVSNNGENSTVFHDGKTYANGEVVLKMTTNKKGVAKTGKTDLPFGKYKLRMCKDKGTKSYAYDKNWSTSVTVKKNGKHATTKKKKPYSAKAVRGGITVKELEAQTNLPIEDVEIAVVNASKSPVMVDGESYAKGQPVLTIISDEDGVAATAKDALPYGTYTLREIVPAEGYELNRDWAPTVEVRKASSLVEADNAFGTLSSDIVQVSEERPRTANTILPFLAAAAALVVVAAIVILSKRHRRKVRNEQDSMSKKMSGKADNAKPAAPPRGMKTTTSNKTYLETAREARQTVSSAKTFEELSRDSYGANLDEMRKSGSHGKRKR